MESEAMIKKNKKDGKSKGLVAVSFPQVIPTRDVGEYFQSKILEKAVVRYPEWDIPQASVSMELIWAKRALLNAEQTLDIRRLEAKGKRRDMDVQWKELEEKENSLKETFIKFNSFVKENTEKRSRADKKIEEAIVAQHHREREIEELKGKMKKMLEDKAEMEQYIKQYRLYENYLGGVIKLAPEYKTVNDILTRYEALIIAKKELAERQEIDLNALESARNDMMKLTEEKSLEKIGLNNQMAELQGRYELAVSKALEWETTVTKIKTITSEKLGAIDSVRTSCWNVYLQMCKRKEVEPEIAREDIESQLMFIKKTLTQMKFIIRHAKKKDSVSSTYVQQHRSKKKV